MSLDTRAFERFSNFADLGDMERRQNLLAGISAHSGVQTSNYNSPYVTHIVRDLKTPMAIRESKQFGITQVLYGIVSAGTHGIAIATAYGLDVKSEGQTYLTQVNADPYMQQTKLLGILQPNRWVDLDGRGGVIPDLRTEGQDLSIAIGTNKELKLKNKQRRFSPLKLMTAAPDAGLLDKESVLTQEIGTWTVPPDFLRRAIKKANSRKPQTKKRSYYKKLQKAKTTSDGSLRLVA